MRPNSQETTVSVTFTEEIFNEKLRFLCSGNVSCFWISGQSFINKNCYNSKTSDDIDMEHRPVTKFNKGIKKLKKINDAVISVNCDVIAIFQIYGHFGGIRKPNSGRMVCNILDVKD